MLTKSLNLYNLQKLSVPTGRYITNFTAYGVQNGSRYLSDNFVYFTPIYTNVARTISEIKFLVATAFTSSGVTLQVAAYNSRQNIVGPSTQIADSLTTGITGAAATKTLTYSPTWILPVGLSFIGIKPKTTASSTNGQLRSHDGNGREDALIGVLGIGVTPANAAADFAGQFIPIISDTVNTNLSADYSSATLSYGGTGGGTPIMSLLTAS